MPINLFNQAFRGELTAFMFTNRLEISARLKVGNLKPPTLAFANQ